MRNGDVYINGVGSYDGTNYADAQTLQEVINSQSGGGVGKVYKSVQGTGEIFNDYTDNKAIGNNAHAEGSRTTAEGTCSHTEGQYTSTRDSYAHAEGFQTIANNMYEHAQGKHNISNTGSSDSDKTIHSIKDLILKEVEALCNQSKQILQSVETNKNIVNRCQDILSEYNPAIKEKKRIR